MWKNLGGERSTQNIQFEIVVKICITINFNFAEKKHLFAISKMVDFI